MNHLFFLCIISTLCTTACGMEPVEAQSSSGLSSRFSSQDVVIPLEQPKLELNAWKQELKTALRGCRTERLLSLLSEENAPQATQRGFHFKPYDNALEQILAHKEQEVRILTNIPEPDAKYFRCCNTTHVWNRFVAPTIIVTVKISQVGFAAWGIVRAARIVLEQAPGNYVEAAANAAPAIGSLVSAFGDLPFSLISAWRRRILKTQQAKYEYYLLAENSVLLQQQIARVVLDNQKDLKELLKRNPQATEVPLTASTESPHENYQELDEQFGTGIVLKAKK